MDDKKPEDASGPSPIRNAQGKFLPGISGNPAGRPKGCRSHATVAAQLIIDEDARRLTRKVVDMALAGDQQCLRLCVERLVPPRKDRPLPFAMPEVSGLAGMASLLGGLLSSVAAGEITPGEAGDLSKLVMNYVETLKISELESRLAALEGGHG